jgi:hypothetical protein
MVRAAPLLTLLCAGSLAACGSTGARGTSSATTAPSHTTAQPRPGHGSRSPTHAQALRFANAVNLTAADVPGFHASAAREHEATSPLEAHLEREMLRCVGAQAAGKGIAEASSPSFERQGGLADQSVSSEVTVSTNSGVSAGELKAINGPHTKACLSHYFNTLFHGRSTHGATFGPVSIAQGTPPASGVDGSFGWRISTSVSGHGVRIPFYIDLLGFVDGPAEASLLSSGAPLAFPAATEQRLYLTMLSRARTHRL